MALLLFPLFRLFSKRIEEASALCHQANNTEDHDKLRVKLGNDSAWGFSSLREKMYEKVIVTRCISRSLARRARPVWADCS